MQLIDGNAIAQTIFDELKNEVQSLQGRPPGVTFVRVGEDPASVIYVNKKHHVAAEIGIRSELKALPEHTNQDELLAVIDELNSREDVDGILVQSPLPPHIDERTVFNHINPDKDVDGFNVINIGRLCQEDPHGFVACTPAGIIELLHRSGIQTSGKRAVVVGRSLIVGKPAALLLMMKAATGNATVTICHSRTNDLQAVIREADIVIAAIGRAHFITREMVKPGAVVIDVGINRIPDASRKKGYRIVGDVDFESVAPLCSHITPVPGGVGPMTIAMLMKNTLAARRRRS